MKFKRITSLINHFLPGKTIVAGLATKGLVGAGFGGFGGFGIIRDCRRLGIYLGLVLLLIGLINGNTFADCSTEIANEELPEALDWKDKVLILALGIAVIYLLFFHSGSADASSVASPSPAPNSSPIVVQFSEAPANVQAFGKNALADSRNYEPKTIEELGQTGTDLLNFFGKK